MKISKTIKNLFNLYKNFSCNYNFYILSHFYNPMSCFCSYTMFHYYLLIYVINNIVWNKINIIVYTLITYTVYFCIFD